MQQLNTIKTPDFKKLPGLEDIYSQPGFIPDGSLDFCGDASAGQELVMSGYPGMAATLWMYRQKKDKLLEKLPVHFVEEASRFEKIFVKSPLEAADQTLYSGYMTVYEGGVYAALWRFAGQSGKGIIVNQSAIPWKQHTIEFCEELNVNPSEILSGGCMIFAADAGYTLTAALEQAGIPAQVIGRVVKGTEKRIDNEEGQRYLNRPAEDEIYKLAELTKA